MGCCTFGHGLAPEADKSERLFLCQHACEGQCRNLSQRKAGHIICPDPLIRQCLGTCQIRQEQTGLCILCQCQFLTRSFKTHLHCLRANLLAHIEYRLCRIVILVQIFAHSHILGTLSCK